MSSTNNLLAERTAGHRWRPSPVEVVPYSPGNLTCTKGASAQDPRVEPARSARRGESTSFNMTWLSGPSWGAPTTFLQKEPLATVGVQEVVPYSPGNLTCTKGASAQDPRVEPARSARRGESTSFNMTWLSGPSWGAPTTFLQKEPLATVGVPPR